MTCSGIEQRLADYLAGTLDAETRAAVRAHVHACPDCLARVLSVDPLQLFAPLADEKRPEASWDGFWEGIQTGIVREETARRAAASRRLAPAWIAAAAALVILLGGWLLLGRAGRETQPETTIADASPVFTSGVPLPQTVEQVLTPASRDVQVFSMAYQPDPMGPGGADGAGTVTELVLIVDAGLEL